MIQKLITLIRRDDLARAERISSSGNIKRTIINGLKDNVNLWKKTWHNYFHKLNKLG